MRRSIEPALWLPFAAGGLFAALITPALVLVTGVLAPLGWLDLAYPKMLAIAGSAVGKLALFTTIALPTWHAAYRLRMTMHDLGLGGGGTTKLICYGAAGLLVCVSIAALLAI
jgi:fumarate reductase subunit D